MEEQPPPEVAASTEPASAVAESADTTINSESAEVTDSSLEARLYKEAIQLQLREELEEKWRSPRRGHGFHKAHGGLRKHILQLRAASMMRDADQVRHRDGNPLPLSPDATRITWAC